MLAQLPGAGEIFLDHVAHFVPAMPAAAAALEACGFRLTRFTAQVNRIDGKTVPAGTGNRCAMFRRGYIEILAATEDTPLARQLQQRLARHVGLHLAAFSSTDAEGQHRRLAATGFQVLPLVDMHRPVATEDGEAQARFTIARIADGRMPEGRIQILTHHTENLVWRAPYLDHPNGAQALLALWIGAVDPADPAERFARFTGRPARCEGEVVTIRLDRGSLRFASADYLQDQFGIVGGPPLPHLAAYEIEIADLGRLRHQLTAAGFAIKETAEGIALNLPPAIGGAIAFRPPTG